MEHQQSLWPSPSLPSFRTAFPPPRAGLLVSLRGPTRSAPGTAQALDKRVKGDFPPLTDTILSVPTMLKLLHLTSKQQSPPSSSLPPMPRCPLRAGHLDLGSSAHLSSPAQSATLTMLPHRRSFAWAWTLCSDSLPTSLPLPKPMPPPRPAPWSPLKLHQWVFNL